MEIKIYTETDNKIIAKWKRFVDSHEDSSVYNTPEFYSTYKSTSNYNPGLIYYTQNDEITGILLYLIITEGTGIKKNFTSRSIINGSPLAVNNDPDIISQLLTLYDKSIKSKAIYSEFREIIPFVSSELIVSKGFEVESRINILIDLTKDEDLLWKEVNSKRRNEIRRAEKKGIVVKELIDQSLIAKSCEILSEVYERAKLPIANKSLFLNAFKFLFPQKMARFFGAFHNDVLIGTMYNLCYKDRVIDWYAGSKKEYYDKYPNDLITWEVIKLMKSEGYKIFDFGGAGKPDVPYGVRDYKKKFGGEFIDLKRYRKIHKPMLYKLGEYGIKYYKFLKF